MTNDKDKPGAKSARGKRERRREIAPKKKAAKEGTERARARATLVTELRMAGRARRVLIESIEEQQDSLKELKAKKSRVDNAVLAGLRELDDIDSGRPFQQHIEFDADDVEATLKNLTMDDLAGESS